MAELKEGGEVAADIPVHFVEVFAPHDPLWLSFNLNLNRQGVQQNNNSDCGIFAIHFARMFLKDPDFYSKSIKVTFLFCEEIETLAHAIQTSLASSSNALWCVEDVPYLRAQLRKNVLEWGREYLQDWIQGQEPK